MNVSQDYKLNPHKYFFIIAVVLTNCKKGKTKNINKPKKKENSGQKINIQIQSFHFHVHHRPTGIPDPAEPEGCKARILTSYFLKVDEVSLPEAESEPSDTSG